MYSTLYNFLAVLVIATTAFAAEHDSPLTRSRARSARHRSAPVDKRQVATGGYSYVGCVTDGSARVLTGSYTWTTSMSVDDCVTQCSAGNYTYAGLENGNQCYCGNSLANNLGKTAAESQCSAVCAGDKTQKCGGAYRMSLYITASAYKPISLGCYIDATSPRTLTGSYQEDTKMTPALCSAKCAAGNYKYAGLEYGRQCYCGNTLDQSRQTSSGCSVACPGDTKSTCGGSYRLNVYQLSGPPPATTSVAPSTTSQKPSTTVKPSTTAKPSTTSVKPSTTSVKPSSSAPAPAASVYGVKYPPSDSKTKYVWAHHMVGNTYSYTPATWADDISKAIANGIDGFALNMGRDDWEPARIADAFAAAEDNGRFKLFFSFDVSSLGCSSTANAANLVDIIMTYANSTAQAKYQNKVLVSTFAGENCNFGQNSTNNGWAYVKKLLTDSKTAVYLMPSIFSDPAGFKNFDWMDGEFNWNSAWPMTADPISTATDEAYMSALGTKGYMPAMSPAFFTYYGVNSYNKNWIYRGDDWLLATRMEQIIAMRNRVDMVEIISWNDYGESHYIGPIRADQPNSQGWTNGMDHQGWLSVIKLYATAFKTGKYPSNTDSITIWSRPHPKGATATAPSNPRPSGWQNTDDKVYAFITVTNPSTVTVFSGTSTKTWTNVPPGVNKFSVGSAAGSIGAKIVRNGNTIKQYNSGSAFQYTDSPADYNFNYFVGQA